MNSERERFEAWCKTYPSGWGLAPETILDGTGAYEHDDTQVAWLAWQAARQDWQPIETAPKDGTWMVVCQSRNGIIKIARWSDIYKHWSTGITAMCYLAEVSHWMPLPPAPQDRG